MGSNKKTSISTLDTSSAFDSRFEALPVALTIRLGSVKIAIKDLMDTPVGEMIELDQAAGSELTVYSGDIPLAKGNIVKQEGGSKLGFKITEIMLPHKNIKVDPV